MLIQQSGRVAACVLVTLAVEGCGQGDSRESRTVAAGSEPIVPTLRTEDGVTIMEHGGDALDRAPRLVVDPAPMMVAGGASGDPAYDLTRVSYAVPLSDGRVFTFSSVGNHVFLFGSDGKGERSFGRTGKGPGDWMRFGTPLRLTGDTVLVIDFANQRLNWLTADNGVVRTAPLTMSGRMMRMHGVAGILPSGEAVMHSAGVWGAHDTDSLHRSLADIFALDLASSAARTVATVPDLTGVEYETRYRGRARMAWRPLRLAGWALVAVWDSVIATVESSRPEIDLRDATGEIRGQLVVRRPGRAVTDAMRAAQTALELARLSAPATEALIDPEESRRIAREAPFADTLPRYAHLLTSPDGTLWAVDAIAPSDSGWSATAFRGDGAIVGRLQVPGRSTPMAFAGDRVIVRTEDENGVVAIHVLALRRATGERWGTDRSRQVNVPPP